MSWKVSASPHPIFSICCALAPVTGSPSTWSPERGATAALLTLLHQRLPFQRIMDLPWKWCLYIPTITAICQLSPLTHCYNDILMTCLLAAVSPYSSLSLALLPEIPPYKTHLIRHSLEAKTQPSYFGILTTRCQTPLAAWPAAAPSLTLTTPQTLGPLSQLHMSRERNWHNPKMSTKITQVDGTPAEPFTQSPLPKELGLCLLCLAQDTASGGTFPTFPRQSGQCFISGAARFFCSGSVNTFTPLCSKLFSCVCFTHYSRAAAVPSFSSQYMT